MAHGLIFTLTLECNACPIQKTNAWSIPETDDTTPRAEVAPVDEEIGRAEAPDPHLAAPEAAAPRPEETQGLRLVAATCDRG